MDEARKEQNVGRILQVLSLPKLGDLLSSPEKFKSWVANAEPGDFRHFISGINHLLVRAGRPEQETMERGIKQRANIYGERETTADGDQDFAIYVPPTPEEIPALLASVLEGFKARISQDDFEGAARFMYDSIVLLQPFLDANKRTARAIFYAVSNVGVTSPGFLNNLPNLIRDDLVAAEDQRPDFARMSEDVVDRYKDNLNAVIQDALQKHRHERGIEQVLDSRELRNDSTQWELNSQGIPDDPDTVARLGEHLDATFDATWSALYEVIGTAGMHSERLSTQLGAFAILVLSAEYPDECREMNISSKTDGIDTFDVRRFVTELIANIERPEYQDIFREFISLTRLARCRAVEKTLFAGA